MKKILLPLFIFIVFITNAQVGIGTTSPNGLLDITASSASSPTTTDGLLIPRVLAFPNPVGIAQNGMMVFLTTDFSGNKVGLYYYDFPSLTWKWMSTGNNGNVWAFNNANTRIEIPFQSDGLTARPTGNEVVALDNGNFGIGTSNPLTKLNIVGTERVTSSNNIDAFSEEFVLVRNITQAVNSFTEIGDFNTINGTTNNGNLSLEISLISQHSGGGFANKYIINANYDDFNGTGWREILPFSTTGDRAGIVALDIGGSLITGSYSPIRLRIRTKTALSLATIPVSISIKSFNNPINTILTGTGTDLTSVSLFRNTPLTQYRENVGIGTAIPTEKLTLENGNFQLGEPLASTALGRRFYFSDSASNGDPIYFQRENVGTDRSNLNLFLGDNFGNGAGFGERFNIFTTNSANVLFTVNAFSGNVGINAATPSEKLEVAGNIRYSGALMPNNNAGTSGQVLTSAGAGVAPTWNSASSVTTNEWHITGNGSTFDGTNFIGTTDNIPFNFRVNNLKSGRISQLGETFFGFESGKNNPITGNATTNTAFGYRSFTSNSSSTARDNVAIGLVALTLNNGGNYNTALGSGALKSNVGTSYNTALGKDALSANIADYNTSVGWEALVSNTTGTRNIGIGIRPLRYYTNPSDNIAIGYEALVGNVIAANNTGTNNTIIGNFSMTANTSGTENVTLGNDALRANISGSQNTAIGYQALLANTTGSENTSIGRKSMPTNTSGSANTAVGFNALFLNNGNNNTGIGRNALFFNSTGSNNSALGWNSLFTNKTGVSNTALGYGSLYTNDNGNQNVAVGEGSLYKNIAGSNNTANGYNSLYNNTASDNSAFGYQSLYNNLSGTFNVGIGTNSLYSNRTGDYNVGIGNNALNFNLSGSSNTAIGYSSLYTNSVGINNTAIGRNALNFNTASNNTAIGHTASYKNTSGTGNVAIGYQSLYENLTGTNNTAVGLNSLQTSTGSNNTAIGNNVLALNTIGNQNTAVGENALSKNTIGAFNDAFGHRALWNVTSGLRNSGYGSTSLSLVTTGADNVALGYNAGGSINTGSRNIAIGNNAQVPTNSSDDQMSIGNVIYGKDMASITTGKIGIGITNPFRSLEVSSNARITSSNPFLELNGNFAAIPNLATFRIRSAGEVVLRSNENNASISDWEIKYGTGTNALFQDSFYISRRLNASVLNPDYFFVINNTGNIGINNSIPTEKLDVTGNIKFSGAIMPNNIAGTTGQVLISAGAGVAPTWDSNPVKPIFKTSLTGVYNLTAANYTVRVNVGTATGINLPTASTSTGKIFVIIGFDGLATIPFTTSGGSIIDEALGITITTLNGNDRYTIQSDGTDWIVIGR